MTSKQLQKNPRTYTVIDLPTSIHVRVVMTEWSTAGSVTPRTAKSLTTPVLITVACSQSCKDASRGEVDNYAAIYLLYSNDGEPARLEPLERMAI